MLFDLSGRVALVTGAGQGMGVGIVRALAGQGASEAVNDLHADRAAAVAAEHGGFPVVFDVTHLDDVHAGVAAVERALGPVDIAVNNAGIPADGFRPTPFRDMDPADWDRFIQLNLHGVLNVTKAVLDGMCDRGWGRVITISSEGGRQGLPIGISLYGAGKAGALGFSRNLAAEVGRHGVTVNAIALGSMDNTPARPASVANPTGRQGTPDDVGAAVVYLVSDEAGWVTGQTLAVNGGAFMS